MAAPVSYPMCFDTMDVMRHLTHEWDCNGELRGVLSGFPGEEPSATLTGDLIIYPKTGELTGERGIIVESDSVSSFPVGTTESRTAATTTVVDGAPTGGTPCEHIGPGMIIDDH